MNKRVVSMMLALIMMMSVIPVFAQEAGNSITVFFSMSKYGEFVKSKDGADMAEVEVTLTGKDSYTLDDAFLAAHTAYYEDGAQGYATSMSEQWGLSVDMLWGDTSKFFGYQVNGGQESVMGPGHVIENGDYIDAYINRSEHPDNEAYSFFDTYRAQAYCGEEIMLTLTQAGGYDKDWNTIYIPCEGAVITVNGKESEIVTDTEGKATLLLDQAGEYVISAKKSKTVKDETVPAITAPICMIEIKIKPAIQMMHNIAAQYAEVDVVEADSNLPWIVADMMCYEKAFPESNIKMSKEKKQEALKEIVALAQKTTRPGDMAKSILAIRALGYDAKNVYTTTFEQIDVAAKLTALVDRDDTAVTNVYTLPYVLIALSQGEGYATKKQIEKLVQAAVDSADVWLDVTEGTDALTPMIFALAPYYNTNDAVKTCLDRGMKLLKEEQREDGLIDGFEGYESASTGLAICAFSAMGINAEAVVNGENSLIDGLLSTTNQEENGFSNAFATEQGFRGLLAWYLLSQNAEKGLYDFTDYPLSRADVSGSFYSPVIFEVNPSTAKITVKGQKALRENCYDLKAGTYTYTVSASGYESETGQVTVTAEEEEGRVVTRITISLSKKNDNTFSGGGGKPEEEEEIEEPEQTPEDVKEPEEEIEKPEQPPEDVKEPEEEKKEEQVVSVQEVFSDVKSGDWYYPAVQFVYENKLFSGTDKGFEPNISMTRSMLVAVLYRLAAPSEVTGEHSFVDVPDDAWYSESVKWATSDGIVSGMSETEFAPNADITREQIAVILYRYAAKNGANVVSRADVTSYSDAADISAYAKDAMEYAVAAGIIYGRDDNNLAPKNNATRAEVATMLMRFLGVLHQ